MQDVTTQRISNTEKSIWDAPLCEYSLITLVAIAAISCVVVGALAYSNIYLGLNGIGEPGSIAMMVGGSLLLVGEIAVVLGCKQKDPVSEKEDLLLNAPSKLTSKHEEFRFFKTLLKNKEVFVFYDEDQEESRIYMDKPNQFFHIAAYNDLIKNNHEVSLKELEERALANKFTMFHYNNWNPFIYLSEYFINDNDMIHFYNNNGRKSCLNNEQNLERIKIDCKPISREEMEKRIQNRLLATSL